MQVNPVLAHLGSSPMADIHDRARSLRASGVDLVDFSIGDPREPTPAFIPAALRAAVPVVSQYPTTSGMPETRAAVAAYVQRRFGRSIDPDTQVIPTAGSKEAIFSTPLAFLDRTGRRTVIYPTPGYATYERGTKFAGGDAHEVRLSGDFRFRASDVARSVWDEAAMVWVNSPHNPTGAVSTRDELHEIYAVARASDTLVCADECYADVYVTDVPASILEVADDALTGVLSFLTLSKRSGMTGYRAAAIVGDEAAIRALKDLRSATGTASPEFVQAAAIAAWSDDDHVVARRKTFAEKRNVLREVFDRHGYPTVASEAGLYLWIEVEDDEAIAKDLLEHHIVVSPGRVFGPGGEGHIRLALVPTLEECQTAVEVLETCLTNR